jgi:hypothetical protein
MYRNIPYSMPMRPSLTYLFTIESGREVPPRTERKHSPADFLQPVLQDRKFVGGLFVTVAVGGLTPLVKDPPFAAWLSAMILAVCVFFVIYITAKRRV